jgi:hypothetical protein
MTKHCWQANQNISRCQQPCLPICPTPIITPPTPAPAPIVNSEIISLIQDFVKQITEIPEPQSINSLIPAQFQSVLDTLKKQSECGFQVENTQLNCTDNLTTMSILSTLLASALTNYVISYISYLTKIEAIYRALVFNITFLYKSVIDLNCNTDKPTAPNFDCYFYFIYDKLVPDIIKQNTIGDIDMIVNIIADEINTFIINVKCSLCSNKSPCDSASSTSPMLKSVEFENTNEKTINIETFQNIIDNSINKIHIPNLSIDEENLKNKIIDGILSKLKEQAIDEHVAVEQVSVEQAVDEQVVAVEQAVDEQVVAVEQAVDEQVAVEQAIDEHVAVEHVAVEQAIDEQVAVEHVDVEQAN